MTPPFRGWADLPPELLRSVAQLLDGLNCYAGARGACTAWRRALAPPTPSLLLIPDDASGRPSAASLPAGRCFDLSAFPSGAHCVGSGHGWLALAFPARGSFSLFNPVTAAEIVLPPLFCAGTDLPSKIVFAPNPARDDFAAAAVRGTDRLAHVSAGATRWAVLDPLRLADGDQLADLVYHEEEGKVYCLTRHGDVHVLCLPESGRRQREPAAMVDHPSSSGPALSQPHQEPAALATGIDDQLGMLPLWRRGMFLWGRVKAELLDAPDLDAPVKAEPLHSVPLDAATSFPPPYNKVSAFTSAKNLVFCDGNLYQIWRNTSCTVTLQLPGGGRRRVAQDEVFVLRYYPQRHPCWDAVTDLGGYSVFLGRNNAVSVRAEDVPGLKGNCVYWIGGRGRDQGMVFDMATRRSTACLLPAAAGGAPQSTICWYFLS